MLCGAILSATGSSLAWRSYPDPNPDPDLLIYSLSHSLSSDPVAVISLLKDCGASEKLTMLVTCS